MLQELESEKLGKGLEHQFPHEYSQVGIGETVVVTVHDDRVGDGVNVDVNDEDDVDVDVGVGVGVELVELEEETGGTYPQGSED